MPTDAIDLASVEIHDSPDVRGWAATTSITGLHFLGERGMVVDFTKRDGPGSWPDVTPPGWSGPIEFTIWIFIGLVRAADGVKEWHAAGIIQCFRNADGTPSPNGGNVGALGQVANNWLYSDRWGAMKGYQPKRGELVGFMVTAGDARGPGDVSLRERSNVVAIPFPGPDPLELEITDYEPGPAPGPIDPLPTPAPTPAPGPAACEALEELLKQHEDLAEMRHAALLEALHTLKLTGTISVPMFGGKGTLAAQVVTVKT